jgi:hypothetical protein
MKLAVFAALALVATGACAESIKVTSELSMNGKVIEQFSGAKPAGETQHYGNIKSIPYKKAATQIGSKVNTEEGFYEDGFKMAITPRITSTGDIRYEIAVSQHDLIKLVPHKVGDAEIESPQGTLETFTQIMFTKAGEPHEFRYGDVGETANKYVLKVTATTLTK